MRRHLGAEEARHELPDLGHEASAVGHARGKGVQGGLRGVVVGLGTAGTQNAGEARDKHVALPDRVHLEGTVLAEALGDHEDVLHVVEDGVLSQQGSEGVALGHRRKQDHDRCARVREVRHGVRAGHDARLGPLNELGDEALLHDRLAASSRKLEQDCPRLVRGGSRAHIEHELADRVGGVGVRGVDEGLAVHAREFHVVLHPVHHGGVVVGHVECEVQHVLHLVGAMHDHGVKVLVAHLVRMEGRENLDHEARDVAVGRETGGGDLGCLRVPGRGPVPRDGVAEGRKDDRVRERVRGSFSENSGGGVVVRGADDRIVVLQVARWKCLHMTPMTPVLGVE